MMEKDFILKNDLEFMEGIQDSITNPYIRMRLLNQLEWYMVMAGNCEKKYHVVGCFSIMIPIVVLVLNTETWLPLEDNLQHLFIVILSGLNSILNSLSGLFGWHENMIRYRANAERLKSETSLYLGGADKYEDVQTRDRIFLKTIENLSMEENNEWQETQQNNEKEDG